MADKAQTDDPKKPPSQASEFNQEDVLKAAQEAERAVSDAVKNMGGVIKNQDSH